MQITKIYSVSYNLNSKELYIHLHFHCLIIQKYILIWSTTHIAKYTRHPKLWPNKNFLIARIFFCFILPSMNTFVSPYILDYILLDKFFRWLPFIKRKKNIARLGKMYLPHVQPSTYLSVMWHQFFSFSILLHHHTNQQWYNLCKIFSSTGIYSPINHSS